MKTKINSVAITGAGGFLGEGIVSVLARHYELRRVDRRPAPDLPGEDCVLDVRDLEQCHRIVEGMDALVIAHMASRRNPDAYLDPVQPMDVNVKGCANLFHAALEHGIQRICLISSAGTMKGYPEGTYFRRNMAMRSREMYSLSKVLQENVAEHFNRLHRMPVAVFRPSGIVDASERISKYGADIPPRVEHVVDRRDIGEGVHKALQLDGLDWEIFYIFGHSSADRICDAAYTRKRLDWSPKFGDAALEALYH